MAGSLKPVIFLDDGGVMNDNALRGPQWQRLLGEFMPQHLGGQAEVWAEANRQVFDKLFDNYLERRFGRKDVSFRDYQKAYAVDWVHSMCKLVGVPLPAEADCLDLLKKANAYVTPLVRSALPGVIEAIRVLKGAGYAIFTASNETSDALEGYLMGMGVVDCFERLYGSDLVGILKETPNTKSSRE